MQHTRVMLGDITGTVPPPPPSQLAPGLRMYQRFSGFIAVGAHTFVRTAGLPHGTQHRPGSGPCQLRDTAACSFSSMQRSCLTLLLRVAQPRGTPGHPRDPPALRRAQVLLLENTRFSSGDEGNSVEYASALTHGADAFVLDAFGVCHRNQASVTGVCRRVPLRRMGLLVQAELKAMLQAVHTPARCPPPPPPPRGAASHLVPLFRRPCACSKLWTGAMCMSVGGTDSTRVYASAVRPLRLRQAVLRCACVPA